MTKHKIITRKEFDKWIRHLKHECAFSDSELMDEIYEEIRNREKNIVELEKCAKQWEAACEKLKKKYEPMVLEES